MTTPKRTFSSPSTGNASDLNLEFEWLRKVIQERISAHIEGTGAHPVALVSPPELDASESPYAQYLLKHELEVPDRIILLLALSPHIQPQLPDIFQSLRQHQPQQFAEFGGAILPGHSGLVPTAQTALFVLAGNDLNHRFACEAHLGPEAPLFRSGTLTLQSTSPNNPSYSAILQPSGEFLASVTTGQIKPPRFSTQFPAQHVVTQRTWQDLVLPEKSIHQLQDLLAWMQHGHTVMDEWGMRDRLNPGYRALFYGPPGTGKTFTATLLGKATGRDVYRIDLSMVVSKYIGETEKNLERVFSQAEHKDWILFFDEADALFGKRTQVSDAHDRYANQEVSYLLQRVEAFDGTVILASNNKDNIDVAFSRRFQAMIHFPMPGPRERRRLWEGSMPPALSAESSINFDQVGKNFELSGGAIMNVIRYCATCAAARGETVIRLKDLEEGIRREYLKVGRVLG